MPNQQNLGIRELKSLNSHQIYASEALVYKDSTWVMAPAPLLDSGLVFTSLRVNKGHAEFWTDHCDRLSHSIHLKDEWKKNILQACEPLESAALRLTILPDQSIEILKRDLKNPVSTQVLKLKIQAIERPRLMGGKVKKSSYAEVVEDLNQALAEGFDDLVYVQEQVVLESSFSNIFMITENRVIWAPRPRAGILEGIYLKNFLDAAKELGFTVKQASLPLDQLLQARAIGLSNCLRGIRLAAVGEKSYDNEEFFSQLTQPIVERMHEKDRSKMSSL